MSVTRPVVKTETLKKSKNQTSLGISLPLESGQLERWYFHLGASNGISVRNTSRRVEVYGSRKSLGSMTQTTTTVSAGISARIQKSMDLGSDTAP